MSTFPPIRACLFDLDGLLINSEDAYHEIDNTILREHGRPDLPWSIKAQMQGRSGQEAHRIFHDWARLPLSPEEHAARVRELEGPAFSNLKLLPGVENLLRRLLNECETVSGERVHIAIVTSSSRAKFEIKTTKFGALFSQIQKDNIIVGDDGRITKGRGKPFPDMYLLALTTINENLGDGERAVTPDECLAFEDSILGVESVRRAGMRVIWCPHPGLLKEFKGKEDAVLMGTTSNYATVTDLSNMDDGKQMGELKHVWAELVPSLEGFDIGKYGMVAIASHADKKG